MPQVIQIPAGTSGFDANSPVSFGTAREFVTRGYRFALRYAPRDKARTTDLTSSEVQSLLHAGLGIMVVQHVELGEWKPSQPKGVDYGQVAAAHAKQCGIMAGTNVWLDLESVDKSVSHMATLAYCSAWFHEVAAVGYTPGLYVGSQCGLTPAELYYGLPFRHYWAAYNLNIDEHPAVRDVQMKQQLQRQLLGVWFDPDLVQKDKKGMLPLVMAPDEWDI